MSKRTVLMVQDWSKFFPFTGTEGTKFFPIPRFHCSWSWFLHSNFPIWIGSTFPSLDWKLAQVISGIVFLDWSPVHLRGITFGFKGWQNLIGGMGVSSPFGLFLFPIGSPGFGSDVPWSWSHPGDFRGGV